jgi:hypothetical protein
MFTNNSPHSPLHTSLDAYLCKPTHISSNNRHAGSPTPLRNRAVELEDHLGRDKVLVAARRVGEAGLPEVGSVILRDGGSAAERSGAYGWKDRWDQRGLREGRSFEDLTEPLSIFVFRV